MRQAILVLGMHRSGTSALTRVLSLLGAALPKHVMPPVANNNETGFWEPERLAALHDQMLAEAGSRWDDWRAFDTAALPPERLQHYKAEIARLIDEEYGDAPLFVLKDPRICRFVGLYADILTSKKIDVRYIISVRNPLAVMASLAKRDGFTSSYSALLWLRYTLDAEYVTRSMPRAFFFYKELMRDWRAGVDKASRALSMRWPRVPEEAAAEINAYLSPQYQHHVVDESQLPDDERVIQWAKDTYAALKALERNTDDMAPLGALDRVRAEFDAAVQIFGEPFYGELGARERTAADIVTNAQKIVSQRTIEIGKFSTEVAQRNADLATQQAVFAQEKIKLQQHIDEQAAKLEQIKLDFAAREASFARERTLLQQAAKERGAETGRLGTAAEQRDTEIVQINAEKNALALLVEEMRRSRSWRLTAPFRFVGHLVRGNIKGMRQNGIKALFMHRLSVPISLRLLPINHLQFTGDRASAVMWEMTGNDPHFLVEGFKRPIGPGLYKFTLGLDAPAYLSEPKLYFDTGAGFNENHTQRLRISDEGRSASAIFEVHAAVMRLRLDPSQTPGPLCIKRVNLRRLSPIAWRLGRLVRAMIRQLQSPSDTRRLASHSIRLFREGGWPALRHAVGRNIRRMGDIDQYSYEEWILLYDTLRPEALTAIRKKADSLPLKPLISILMPVYNTPKRPLQEALESVLAQAYPFWEMCIADDASTAPHVRPLLKRYAARDPRIKVIFRTENGHISRASNSALELVAGGWIALLDHDDLLRPHALYEVACAINHQPDAELIYSDEDKIDTQGRRYGAFFKPDFALETFRSKNYLNHLTVHRTENVRAVGGWRLGYEGSQDYDLNLRVVERINTKKIVHIPKILYHWRAVAGSTAAASSEKSYAWTAGLRALEDHLRRTGINGRMEGVRGTPFYRLRLDLPEPRPLVSLIIPTRNRMDLLRGCIESIRSKTTYLNYEIIIVDNESTDPNILNYFQTLMKQDNIRIFRHDGPFNFSAINNRAVKQAYGSIIGLINNDIEVISADWLDEMVSWAAQAEIGCVGAKLYYRNNCIQHAGVILGVGGVAGHSHKYFSRSDSGYFCRLKIVQNLSAVSAACLVVRKQVYEAVGGLNEKDMKVAFNDVDFCLKVMQAGYRNVWTPFAELYHLESVSRGAENEPTKIARFNAENDYMRKQWGELLRNDPFYSPNLTLDREDFSLAFPPRVPSIDAIDPGADLLPTSLVGSK